MHRENLGEKVEKIGLNEIFEHCSSCWLDSKERRLSQEVKSTFLLAFSAFVNVYIYAGADDFGWGKLCEYELYMLHCRSFTAWRFAKYFLFVSLMSITNLSPWFNRPKEKYVINVNSS